jgi:hypothetical protein
MIINNILGPKPLEIDPELKKKMQFYHIIVRVLYMSAAILMGAAAVSIL